MASLLNQRAKVKDPAVGLYGQEGIIAVVVSLGAKSGYTEGKVKCKVLIGSQLSQWIADECLEMLDQK